MEELIGRRTVFAGKLLTVFRDRVRLPGGATAVREVVQHPGSVGLIPVDRRGRVVLVRQYRHAVGIELWEIPAGTAEPGETPAQTAARELEEETGYRAGRWVELGAAYLVPGWCTERMAFFRAERLRPTAARRPADETLSAGAFSPEALRALRAGGEIRDAKTLLGLSWAGFDIWNPPPRRARPTPASLSGRRR